MNYIETSIPLIALKIPDPEIAIAELAEYGYDSFIVEDQQLKSYIEEQKFNNKEIANLLESLLADHSKVRHTVLENKNWNQTLESDYEAISIDNFCHIYAPFHIPQTGFKHHIEIMPKMSFGTGHHQTTRLMIKAMQTIDMTGKSVLDMGSGTGVLAILAHMMGSRKVTAIDIDPNATENCTENIKLNKTERISCKTGDSSAIDCEYDIILANINRNTLLNDLSVYTQHLKAKGTLIMSGFLENDKDIISSAATKLNLKSVANMAEQQWLCMIFEKEQ